MSKDFCMDCGVLLAPDTGICPVCGFDNHQAAESEGLFGETALWDVLSDDVIPENILDY
jgi:uncharacterized OB-fold protein